MGEEEDDGGVPSLSPSNIAVVSDPSNVAIGEQGQDAGPTMTALTPSTTVGIVPGEQGQDAGPTMTASTLLIVRQTRTTSGMMPTAAGRRSRRRDGVPQDSFLFVVSVGAWRGHPLTM